MDIKLFSLQIGSDTNLRVLFYFLNLYNFRIMSYSTITPRVIEFQYRKSIYIFHALQVTYCVTSNQHTLWFIEWNQNNCIGENMFIFYYIEL